MSHNLKVGSCTNYRNSIKKIFCLFLCSIEIFLFSVSVAAEKPPDFGKKLLFLLYVFLFSTM